VVLEGLASEAWAEAELRKHIEVGLPDVGRVVRLQRLPYSGEVSLLLQFGLENASLQAFTSLPDVLRQTLPTSCWEQADDPNGELHEDAPPWVRPPTPAEYAALTTIWLAEKRQERQDRFVAGGGDASSAMDYFDISFRFTSATCLDVDITGRPRDRSGADTPVLPSDSDFDMDLRVWLDNYGTGMSLWSCGLLLGECLWQGLVAVRGRSVLELGCGCAAVPSLVAGHLGATSVLATDLVAEVLATAEENALGHGVSVRRLDWSRSHRTDEASEAVRGNEEAIGRAEVVLWSDAVYTEAGGPLLARACLAHLAKDGVVVAVVPGEDRPGMPEFEHAMLGGGYGRAVEMPIPVAVFDQAAQRFDLTGGLVSTTKGDVRKSRLLCWKAVNLYD